MQLEEEAEAKILQIMPVPPGWEAVWGESYEPAKGEEGFHTELVACWALVEVGERRLAGSRAIPLASSYGDESAVAVATPYLLLTAFYLW